MKSLEIGQDLLMEKAFVAVVAMIDAAVYFALAGRRTEILYSLYVPLTSFNSNRRRAIVRSGGLFFRVHVLQ
jgi:hypothetical protein